MGPNHFCGGLDDPRYLDRTKRHKLLDIGHQLPYLKPP